MAPSQPGSSSTSSILLRKHISRRRSGQLGAVKAAPADENAAPGPPRTDLTPAEPRACGGEAAQPRPPSPPAEPARTLPPASPATAASDTLPDAPTARFQRRLSETNSVDRWFEDQLTPKAAGPSRRTRQPAGAGTPATPPVQSAASQIVDKALRYITSGEVAPAAEREDPGGNVFKLGPSSILDKGLDAITGVGKLMESFAMTLDSVIGQAFEEWGTPKSAERPAAPRALQPRNGPPPRPSQQAGPEARKAAAAAAAGASQHGGGGVTRGSSSAAARGSGAGPRSAGAALKQAHMTSFMERVTDASEEDVAEWHRRALGLQAELQKLQSQIQENQRLRDEYTRMQGDLERTASAVSKLKEENTLLKQQRTPQAQEPQDAEEVDALAAEQVRLQMEALLAEKAKLAQENARLLRENTGLQELLEFTMLAQAELVGDDELFGDDAWPLPPLSSWGDASPCSSEGNLSAASSAGAVGAAAAPPPAAAMQALAL